MVLFDTDAIIEQVFDLLEVPYGTNKISCPFHDEVTPSCFLFDEALHCFGCGVHYDYPHLLAKLLDVSFGQIIAEYGLEPTEDNIKSRLLVEDKLDIGFLSSCVSARLRRTEVNFNEVEESLKIFDERNV